MSITPNNVTRFIKHGLVEKLDRDFQGGRFRIFREPDLHACCYYHLRRLLERHPDWEICNEPHYRELKGRGRPAQHDVVLFYRGRAVALIELKFRVHGQGLRKKDLRVLLRAVKKHKKRHRVVRKAFYLEVVLHPRGKRPRKLTAYRNHAISLLMDAKTLKAYLPVFRKRRKPPPLRKAA